MRLSRHPDTYSHALAGLDALHGAIHLHGPVKCQARGEAGSYPQGVRGFDEHAIRANVARLPAQDCRPPLNLELGAKGIARRPAALQTPRRMLPSGHYQTYPHPWILSCGAGAFTPLPRPHDTTVPFPFFPIPFPPFTV